MPHDATHDEIANAFKVAGILRTDPNTLQPRIKLYKKHDGTLKGDGLVTFVKRESVALAVSLRDGYELRPNRPLAVEPAKFEMRGDALRERDGGSEQATALKRARVLERRQLGEWGDGLLPRGAAASKIVVFKGLFAPAEVAAAEAAGGASAASFYAGLGESVAADCARAGAVDHIHVFEGSEVASAAVRFKRAEDAQRCLLMMGSRCELFDGVSDYRAPHLRARPVETAEEQEHKLESFAQWLEGEQSDEGDAG